MPAATSAKRMTADESRPIDLANRSKFPLSLGDSWTIDSEEGGFDDWKPIKKRAPRGKSTP